MFACPPSSPLPYKFYLQVHMKWCPGGGEGGRGEREKCSDHEKEKNAEKGKSNLVAAY
jgi:hypothetical protein